MVTNWKLGIWVVLWMGCGSPSMPPMNTALTPMTADDNPACASFSWRMPTPSAIACPGVPTCSCAATDVCCVQLDYPSGPTGAPTIGPSSCSALTACTGLALACDGPEDCTKGRVCCGTDTRGGGTSCKDPSECFDAHSIIVCRSDSDCRLGQHCEPSYAGSYLGNVAGSCM
jgi:hypothetical protein